MFKNATIQIHFFSIFLNLKELVEVTKREEIQDA